MELTVYGADLICAGCAQAPPARATAEWLDAAIARKYGRTVRVRYVDLHHPVTADDRMYCKKILLDDYFYPLVVADGEVLGEGSVSLKSVFGFLERSGVQNGSESWCGPFDSADQHR